jgi:hypothetical protein
MSDQNNQTMTETQTPATPPTEGETLRQAQGETPQPLTWDTWHGSLNDEQRKLIEARFNEDTKALKGALDKERDESKTLAKQIKDLQGKAEKGSELEKALTDLQAQLAAATQEKDFILNAPAKGVSNIKAAYKLAVADGLIDAKGEIDWDGLKGAYPELFVQPKPATPPPPNTNATSTSKGVEKNYGGLSLTEVAQRYGIRAG